MARSKKQTKKDKKPAARPGEKEALKLVSAKLTLPYLREIVAKTATSALSEKEQTDLSASIETFAWVMALIEDKNAILTRMRRLLFGSRTESMEKLLAKLMSGPAGSEPEEGAETAESDSSAAEDQGQASAAQGTGAQPNMPVPSDKPRPRGHGRNGVARFTGAARCPVSHERLRVGDMCPECGEGKLYRLAHPSVLVRLEGVGPLCGTVYEKERLRCNGCEMVFTAAAPIGVGEQKYDESVTAMVALLRYGCGMPFHRLSRLQQALGLPLPSSTAFELVETGADAIEAIIDALTWEAAQGQTLHNDDTWVRILKAPEPLEPMDGKDRSERTGLFTTGVLAEVGTRRIALYFTGRQHAGENLKEVLLRRASGLSPPVQMSDALGHNKPVGIETIVSTCLAHARRNFIDISESFPDEVKHVLEQLGSVYHQDAEARRKEMSDEARLLWHQEHSAPVMSELKAWMEKKLADREVEPNSGLGQAMNFMLKRWETFTVFLRIPAAPLDNTVVERALKRAILHRKNSLFFKTLNGARVGDLYMSLIHTCELQREDPFAYLTALLKHASQVDADPSAWLPWTWRANLAAMDTPNATPSSST